MAVGGCGSGQEQTTTNDPVAQEPVVNLPAVPRPQPPLARAELLAAVAEAASASALGQPDGDAERRLDGRQFELRIRFGCRGPATDLAAAWLGWSYDPEKQRLSVRARPTISGDDPLIAQLAAGEIEAVEGFWIPRPWLLEPSCPAAAAVRTGVPAGAEAEAGEQSGSSEDQDRPQREDRPSEQQEGAIADPVPRSPRIGIAQFFTEADARTGRRHDRPYEAFKTLEEGQPLRSQGFNLVLSGRLRARPGMGVIGCSARGPDSPPECVVAAEFDRVWIELPDSSEVIAEWGRN